MTVDAPCRANRSSSRCRIPVQKTGSTNPNTLRSMAFAGLYLVAAVSRTKSSRLLSSASAWMPSSTTTTVRQRRSFTSLAFNVQSDFKNRNSLSFIYSRLGRGLWRLPSSTATVIKSSRTDDYIATTPSKFVHFPFDYHEEVNIWIDSLTNRGLGVGRFDVTPQGKPQRWVEQPDDNGDSPSVNESSSSSTSTQKWVIMVPNVIPGELVRVRIFRNFKNYSEGDLVTVLESSPHRVEPVCPLANECGGCQLQHMSVTSQHHWKTGSVQESLHQYGIETEVSPTLGTEHIFGYRSKLTPHYQAPAKRRRGGPTVKHDSNNIKAIGFLRQTSRSILDVTNCPIATPAVNEKYEQVRFELLSQPTSRTKGATLLFRQANLDDACKDISTNHKDYLTTRVRGLVFTYQSGNFFQNNYYVLPLMVDHVVQHSSVPSKYNGEAMTHLVDCYCGSGLFALSAASHFVTVVGIEINDKAVQEATANAVANDISNCHFRAADAEAIFTNIMDFPRDTTCVVLDPPRKGCSADFLEQLLVFAPRRIVYMSCDPTTQARDAQTLVGTGRYNITSVQPFDLFPQTRHIECLVIFERMD